MPNFNPDLGKNNTLKPNSYWNHSLLISRRSIGGRDELGKNVAGGRVPEWEHRLPGGDRVYGLQDRSAAAPGLIVARVCTSTSIRLGERQP